MTVRIEPFITSLPGLRALRWSCDALYTAMKPRWVIGRVTQGRSTWRLGGHRYTSGPGDVLLRQPGDVQHTEARDGVQSMVVIALPAEGLATRPLKPVFQQGEVQAFDRLFSALEEDAFSVEVALTEALDAVRGVPDVWPGHSRAVRKALEFLHAHFDEAIRLDALARAVEADKFHLCRAFRQQVGLPPHAYLIQLRVLRAQALLSRGLKPAHVAAQVGLSDQSQLNRHFRRFVGTSPGCWSAANTAKKNPLR